MEHEYSRCEYIDPSKLLNSINNFLTLFRINDLLTKAGYKTSVSLKLPREFECLLLIEF